MLRFDKHTRRSVDEILEMAIAFFGTSGMKMSTFTDSQTCLIFEGSGGSVRVCVDEDDAQDWRNVHIDALTLVEPARLFFDAV